MNATTADTDIRQEIQRTLGQQSAHLPTLARSTAAERIAKLKRMAAWLGEERNLAAAKEAMYRDFKKSEAEVLITEIAVVFSHISHVTGRLRRWMSPKVMGLSLMSIGTKTYIHYEPKGLCLVISPWNYPINLSLIPIVYAIAAGNAVVLKPSEMTPHTSAFLSGMMADLFEKEEVAVFEGAVEVATALLEQPFNHIFFTGSPQIGKVVMTAAAKHLTSVTLELGGKSPAIVDETANVKEMAQKTAWGKLVNGGQTCIAPDYMLVHESVQAEFLREYEAAVKAFYDPAGAGVQQSPDYPRIVNQRHFQRLKGLLDDAVATGAQVSSGGQMDAADNFIAPTVVVGVKAGMSIMQEEIFGPLLPVLTYKTPEEAVGIIRSYPKPLALYIGSRKQRNIDYFIRETSAGGTVINDYLLTSSNPELPFGGVNNSGIGKSFGIHGFIEFSNERGIVHRRWWGTLKPLFPPYSPGLNKVLKRALKWL